ncbi:hypothetical protein GCM10010252_17000 [Streptomyces aureoverticillatus]|nr:hypothetical protein GCM10010252_17000 [Streptomyces aureoverticillatus]
MTQPPGQQPGQPQSRPWQGGGGFGAPHGSYGAPQGPYAAPQGPYGAARPTADNPYAQPPQPGHPVQPAQHIPQYGGGYPPPPPPPPKRKTGLIVGAAVLAMAAVAGGVWLAVGQGDDESKKPEAKPSGSATADAEPRESPAPSPEESDDTDEDPYADPDDTEESEEPSGGPTGTTLVGFWRSEKPGGGILGLRESPDTTKPKKASVSLLDGGRCSGLRRVVEPGRTYRIGLICERDNKEIFGDLVFPGGDTLTVTWDKGKSGKETYKRFLDWSEDGAGDGGTDGSGGGGDTGVEGVAHTR